MKRKNFLIGFTSSIILLLLIFDPQTALYAAADGITLCINTVIPSLFPFIILSGIITASFTGSNMPLMRPIGKVCSIPKGCEPLLLLSWLGGYPTGAKCIYQSWKNQWPSFRVGSLLRESLSAILIIGSPPGSLLQCWPASQVCWNYPMDV